MELHLVVINQGNLGVEDLDVSINIKGNLLRGDSFHQRIDYLGPGERRSRARSTGTSSASERPSLQ
jgi:hypothetical protein